MNAIIQVLQAVDNAEISQAEDLSAYLSFFKFNVKSMIHQALEESLIIKDDIYKLSMKGKLKLVKYEIEKILKTEIDHLKILHQGMTNQSFLFEVSGDHYVFRMPGKGVSEMIDRKDEAEAYRLIKDLKISDEIMFINPDQGTKISRFIKNARPIDKNNQKDVTQAMSIIRKLHDEKLESSHIFSIDTKIASFYQLCLNEQVVFFEGFDVLYEDILLIIKKLNKIQRPKVFCHVDTAQSNFIKHGSNMTLLDWEYAGMSDPLLDVAMFANSCEYDAKEMNHLLKTYLNRAYTKEESDIFDMYLALSGFLWGLWSYVKQIYGEDHHAYKKRQFQLSSKYSKIVLNQKHQ